MKNILLHGLGQNEQSWNEVNVDNPKELANVIYDFWKNNQ